MSLKDFLRERNLRDNMNLKNFLKSMTDSRKDALLDMYEKYKEIFHFSKGSMHNHQAWKGGYADHIAECLRINKITYNSLSEFRPLPFTEDSALICLFLHDIEKPFRYGPEDNEECNKWREQACIYHYGWEVLKTVILTSLLKDFGLELTEEEMNALQYAHGEGKDHLKNERVAGPLAAHVHHCDNISARIWFDEGKGLSL